jgi:hypothetical protein
MAKPQPWDRDTGRATPSRSWQTRAGSTTERSTMREDLSGWRTFSGVAFYLVGGFNIVGASRR